MIRYLDREWLPALERACLLEPVYGAKLETLLAVYGVGNPLCDFWVMLDGAGAPSGAMAREDGMVTLALSPAVDLAELAGFLQITGAFGAEGREPWFTQLTEEWGRPAGRSHLLAYRGPSPPEIPRPLDSLTPVHQLLCRADPAFDAPHGPWLCGFSARVRAGHAAAFGRMEGGVLVSTASVYFVGRGCGMIGSVATAPQHRGKGYASQAVLDAAGWVLARGALPVLLPAGEELLPFYRRLGFSPHGETAAALESNCILEEMT